MSVCVRVFVCVCVCVCVSVRVCVCVCAEERLIQLAGGADSPDRSQNNSPTNANKQPASFKRDPSLTKSSFQPYKRLSKTSNSLAKDSEEIRPDDGPQPVELSAGTIEMLQSQLRTAGSATAAARAVQAASTAWRIPATAEPPSPRSPSRAAGSQSSPSQGPGPMHGSPMHASSMLYGAAPMSPGVGTPQARQTSTSMAAAYNGFSMAMATPMPSPNMRQQGSTQFSGLSMTQPNGFSMTQAGGLNMTQARAQQGANNFVLLPPPPMAPLPPMPAPPPPLTAQPTTQTPHTYTQSPIGSPRGQSMLGSHTHTQQTQLLGNGPMQAMWSQQSPMASMSAVSAGGGLARHGSLSNGGLGGGSMGGTNGMQNMGAMGGMQAMGGLGGMQPMGGNNGMQSMGPMGAMQSMGGLGGLSNPSMASMGGIGNPSLGSMTGMPSMQTMGGLSSMGGMGGGAGASMGIFPVWNQNQAYGMHDEMDVPHWRASQSGNVTVTGPSVRAAAHTAAAAAPHRPQARAPAALSDVPLMSPASPSGGRGGTAAALQEAAKELKRLQYLAQLKKTEQELHRRQGELQQLGINVGGWEQDGENGDKRMQRPGRADAIAQIDDIKVCT